MLDIYLKIIDYFNDIINVKQGVKFAMGFMYNKMYVY